MIPAPLRGTHPLVKYINQLREEIQASRVLSFVGGKLERGPNGTKLEANPQAGARVVHVKCCLADGTEAYLPVMISGNAFRTNNGETVTLDIVESDVPDGSLTLE